MTLQDALQMGNEAEDGNQTSRARLARYLGQKSPKPFIYKDKEEGHI